jgi:tetratricopeptide (TPR) repeat protein
VGLRYWLALSLGERGEFATGLAAGEEAIRIAEVADDPFSLVDACWGVGLLYVSKGGVQEAIRVLERGLTVCQTQHLDILFSMVGSGLGYAYALSGRVDEGIQLLDQAVERGASALGVSYLGEAYLLARRMEDASRFARRALTKARAHKERGNEARSLRLLGEIAAHTERPDAEPAEDYYRQALALATDLGMRPLVAHCHSGLGTLYQKVGREAQAYAELRTAVALYRAMEMTFWLEPAEAALAQVAGGPRSTA